MNIFKWWATGENKPLIADKTQISKLYNRTRNSVLWSVVLGYGVFYIGRLTISVAKKPMMDAGILTPVELGIIGSLLFYSYAIGKLTNGFLADRANIRKFISTGLGVSAIMNLAFGMTTNFAVMAILWLFNGWFQSMGSAPCVVSLTQWFSKKEIGTKYGVWAASHSIGEGITFIGTSTVVAAYGWKMGFIGPGVVCLVVAIILYYTLADRPQTYGLPNISDYNPDGSSELKNEEPVVKAKKSIKDFQLQVLKSTVVWKVGLAATFLYTCRYAIHSWGPLYLQEAKGFTLMEAGTIMGVSTMFGLAGAIFSGWFSDRFFSSKRNIPALIMGIVLTISLLGLRAAPDNNVIYNIGVLGLFEFALGCLVVYIGGLWAVDLLPKQAAGSVKGIIGIFSYIGAATQDWISGLLIESGKTETLGVTSYSFDSVFLFWIGSSIVAILIPLTIWKAKPVN